MIKTNLYTYKILQTLKLRVNLVKDGKVLVVDSLVEELKE